MMSTWLVGAGVGAIVVVSMRSRREFLVAGVSVGVLAAVLACVSVFRRCVGAGSTSRGSFLYEMQEANHREIPRLLIAFSRSPDLATRSERELSVALGWAVKLGMVDVAKVLLEHGARFHELALYTAAGKGHVETARVLIEAGARPGAREDESGNTELHEAARMQDLEMVRLLVASGADVKAVNKAGQTPADVAMTWDNRPEQRAAVLKELGYPGDTDRNSVPSRDAP
ncbi:MAG: ankyrin repeat domain-containing protein [Planctomycetota bacterium]|jgi:hypothetical protein